MAESNATFCSRLGKTCGSVTANNNCGTSRIVNCGPATKSCNSTFGTCVAFGIQNCSNGVYGSCNATDPRIANCAGKQCGSDGCGGSCGSCSSGYNCNASGKCVLWTEKSCDSYDNEYGTLHPGCSAEEGCYWTGCIGTQDSCSSMTSSSACLAQQGCSESGTCSGTFDCFLFRWRRNWM